MSDDPVFIANSRADIGIALITKAERAVLDWISVTNRAWAVELNMSVLID